MSKLHGTLIQRRAQAKRWRLRHAAKKRTDNDVWRAAHPDYKKDVEVVRRGNAAYWREHPDARHVYGHRRRALQVGNGGAHTHQEWLDKCALFANLCIYCGGAKPLTEDHKIPLTRGGTDGIANIVPSCASCNSKKHNKTAREFLGLTA